MNMSQSHYLLGKWIECKRATPKEFTYPKKYSQDINFMNTITPQMANISLQNSKCLFQYQNFYPKSPTIQTPSQSFVSYPYCNTTANSNNIMNIQNNTSMNIGIQNNNDCLLGSSRTFLHNQTEICVNQNNNVNSPNDLVNFQEKPKNSNKFNNYFNECITNPSCYNYFHYKLFDSNGEEVNGLVSSYKNKEKVKLFREDSKINSPKSIENLIDYSNKMSDMVSNSNNTNEYIPAVQDIGNDNDESFIGPQKGKLNCFSNNNFFKPY